MKAMVMSDSELRNWAYNPDQFLGLEQDFDLLVGTLSRSDIILECASDEQCPKQLFFLNCAYLAVGSEVVESSTEESVREVLSFVRRAEKTGNLRLLEFVWRARDLIENPENFDYDQWCRGGIVHSLYSD